MSIPAKDLKGPPLVDESIARSLSKLSEERDTKLMPPPPPRLMVDPNTQGMQALHARVPTPAFGSQRSIVPLTALRRPGPEICTSSEIATGKFDFSDGVQGETTASVVPTKRILRESDVGTFLKSSTCQDYMSFIKCLCSKLVGVKASSVQDKEDTSEELKKLLSALDALSTLVDEVPPQEHTLRYGNPAFRQWHARMCERSEDLVQNILPDTLKGSAKELAYYFADSFGNTTRIDYGTGHETNFFVFLYCLAKLGVVKEGDAPALVLSVFDTYLKLMRKIQTTYWLEPAGSRGCWGLDDYQLMPFLFGSAQLINHGLIKPKSIHNADFIELFSGDFMYFSAVKFVLSVKKGPIKETSPMLTDISVLGRWNKVNHGLLKMYQGEVLSKFPIMQHLAFGSLFKWATP
jgi:serine/threonine-protein phosphatase 2A activator